jgi:CheY-like chemotaxis protein
MARVLVIDDDEVTRLFLGKVLEAAKHEVAYAANGEQGLDFYRKSPFDVVVVDLVMPVKSGLQTIRELCERYKDVKIIAVSGVDPEYLPLADDLGAVGTMTKPVDPKKLLELINDATKMSRGWDRVRE